MSKKDLNNIQQNHNHDQELFAFKSKVNEVEVKSAYTFKGVYREAFGKFKRNKLAMWALGFFVAIFVTALLIVPFAANPYTENSSDILLQPGEGGYWFGTDAAGRDLWSRTWWGVIYSISLGLIASTLNIIIAVIVGIASGYWDRVDKVFNWIMKIVFAIPSILILIVFSTVFSPSFAVVIAGMIATSWDNASQQIRAQVLRVKNLDFVTASITLKTNHWKMIKVLLIYSLPTIITQFSILFPRMILLESTLGFLGLSVPNSPTLGNIISSGRAYLGTNPGITLIPSAFLVGIVGSFQFVSFGLEDAFSGR